MKTCPKCGSEFGDEMNFCLNDGERLPDPAVTAEYGEKTLDLPGDIPPPTQPVFSAESTESTEQPTIYRQPESTPPRFTPPGVPKEGSRSRYLLPLVLTGLAFVTFGAAAIGLVGYFYTTRDVAMANVSEVNRSVNPPGVNLNTNSGGGAPPFPESSPPQTNTGSATNTEVKPSPAASPRNPTPAPTKTIDQQTTATPPPIPTPARIPKTVAGGVLNGKAISLPKPAYPPAARAVRAGGAVPVQVLIDEEGRVVSASATAGHPLLRAAAEQAARGARFTPTLLSGQPVKVSGVIVYNFVP